MPGGGAPPVPPESSVSERVADALRPHTMGGGPLAPVKCYRWLSRRCANTESPATGVAAWSHGSAGAEALPGEIPLG
jgi:hypothetical protein